MTSVLKRKDTDMTSGSIPLLLIQFAIPLLIGNIFQQLYNTVDSIVVGNYVSKQALAAVGCTGPIINALIGIFAGLASGAGVVISQLFGAKEEEKLHSAVQTTILLTLIMCVVLSFLGIWLAPYMLQLMKTPEDVMPAASEYLRIFFGGVSGLLLYNIGSGILRAVGDSTRPLYFLIFSAVTNTVLDILFVKYFAMGIAGAAIATVIAQFMSAILVMAVLMRSKAAYRVDIRHMHMTGPLLRKICALGIPTAIQMGITAFSNVFVQSYINLFESSCMAGWAAYNKIDAFAIMPLMSLSIAVTTFVGQNLGAGNTQRAKDGAKSGLLMGFMMVVALVTPLMIFAPQLVGLFNKDPEVLGFGSYFIRLISPFYITLAINQIYSGALRGAGNARATVFIMLGSFVVFRQIYLFIIHRLGFGITAIALGYPMGWMMCSLLLLIYLYKSSWLKKFSPAAPEGVKNA